MASSDVFRPLLYRYISSKNYSFATHPTRAVAYGLASDTRGRRFPSLDAIM